jgi:hypothetical protein
MPKRRICGQSPVQSTAAKNLSDVEEAYLAEINAIEKEAKNRVE